jgi:hypothetical protein
VKEKPERKGRAANGLQLYILFSSYVGFGSPRPHPALSNIVLYAPLIRSYD